MKIYMKSRSYCFKNGWSLDVFRSTPYINIAALKDENKQEILTIQITKLTERLGIVRNIERKCKTKLEIQKENINYWIKGAIIDEEETNLYAVVTPYKQQAYAKIEIRLFDESTYNQLFNAVYIVSFDSYKGIEESISDAVIKLKHQVRYNKVYDDHNIPKIVKRTIWFNNGRYKVEVNNRENFDSADNIACIDTKDKSIVFNVPFPKISFYERAEVLRAVAMLFSQHHINVRMDGEIAVYLHGTYGEFIVKPLDNNNIEISKEEVINIRREYEVSYNDYNGVVQCVNDIIDKLNTNVMKYVDKDQAGDINWKHKEREKEARRRREAKEKLRATVSNREHTIKNMFRAFNKR